MDLMQRRVARQIKIGWWLLGGNTFFLVLNLLYGHWVLGFLGGIAIGVGVSVLRRNYGVRRTLAEIRRNYHRVLHDYTVRARNHTGR